LKIIDSEAAKIHRVIDCLLQIHIAEEDRRDVPIRGFQESQLHQDMRSDGYGNIY
jgi:hypothetical protein